jgi:hypothetical protein
MAACTTSTTWTVSPACRNLRQQLPSPAAPTHPACCRRAAGDKRLDEWVGHSQLQPLPTNQQSLPLAHAHSLPAV